MKSTTLFLVATFSFLFFFYFSNAQVQTGRSNTINGNCGGYYEYLPQGYSANTSQSYPLIVAMHGIGELGNGTSDLPNLLNCWTAIPRLIANGGFPNSFSVGGQSFSFIVISPQFKSWPSSSDVNDVVNYAVQNYRVDQSRIYVTGLSMGGGAVWTFAGDYPTRAAAVVPVCGAWTADAGRAQAIANARLAVWATHNQDDPTVGLYNTTGWINMINQYGGDIISTIFPTSGHDAWSRTYDPGFTQNGVNIYQWMLQHKKGGGSTPAANKAPSVSTTGDQTITLPQSSVTLSANASDPDGSIASYQWSQLSGPSQAGIASAASASTAINNLIQGSYAFRITVTDDKGATAVSDVVIKVNAAAVNQAPSVSTTGDQTITLPQSSVTLSANASDPDGSIASYQWSQLSGPAQAGIASAASASTAINNLIQGSYAFRITVTDDKGATAVSDVVIKVNAAAVNQAPSVSTTGDQTITLPQSSVTLSANASDPDGSIASYQWSQLSGPAQAGIASAASASTAINNLIQGSYAFRITVTDDKGATAVSDVVIKVNAAAVNQAPSVSTTGDQTITLPQSSVTLSANASDPDGSIASYQWSQLSGPAQAGIASTASASTAINNLIQGSYAFRITVTDDKGATAVSDVVIKVNAAAVNQAPSVSTTGDQTITLPQSSVTLSANASDPDGSIASYQWSQLSGPAQAGIASAASASTAINNLIQGSYAFRITVTDDKGATAVSDVVIKVNAAAVNQAPSVSTTGDQTITLPQSSVTLSANASDPDGSIASYQWSQLSGPAQAGIASAASASTAINNLIQGSYAFRITVTDDKGATAVSDVVIKVNAAAVNQAPSVSTTGDQTITLPQSSVTLSANASDPDGSIASYQWSQLSGPAQAGIASAASASTAINNLIQGSYAFRITVTDDKGATAVSDVVIKVNAAAVNQAPSVSTTGDQTITLPQSSVTLSANASDPDGSIASYQWSQLSGPAQAGIASAASASTAINNLIQGSYAFRITVTDDKGATAVSDVVIKVNHKPIANAGSDKVITLPTNAVNLYGIASDPDGSVASYQWAQIAGPTKTNFSSSSPLAFTAHDLQQGIYIFRLTVTDNDGANTWSDVKVTVLPDPTKPSTAMVYPNPATNSLYVKIEAVTLQSNSSIQIKNAAGNILYTENFLRTDFRMLKQLDISKLPSGVYFLTVITDINTSKTLKFIKQ